MPTGLQRSASHGVKGRPTSPAARNKHFVQYATHDHGAAGRLPKMRPQSAMPKRSDPLEAFFLKQRRPLSAIVKPVSFAEDDEDDVFPAPPLDNALSLGETGSGTRLLDSRTESARRMWSSIEQDMLAALDVNCAFLRKKSREQIKVDFSTPASPASPYTPATPKQSRQQSAQYGLGLRKLLQKQSTFGSLAGFEAKPPEEATCILQEMQKNEKDQETARSLREIIGEFQAGVCRVLFGANGQIKRQVIIHALRLTREDGCELMMMARWAPRQGFKPICAYPGAKRPRMTDFDIYIGSLTRDLEPLLSSYEIKPQGSDVKEWSEESSKYQIPTVYLRLLQLATLVPSAGGGKQQHTSSLTEFVANEPLNIQPTKTLSFSVIGKVRQISVVLDHSLKEANVYCWVPRILADLVHTSKDYKASFREWVNTFSEDVSSWCSKECGA